MDSTETKRHCPGCDHKRPSRLFPMDPSQPGSRSRYCHVCCGLIRCYSCQEQKPSGEFPRRKTRPGRSVYCKPCLYGKVKRCIKCNRFKQKTEFPPKQSIDDGYSTVCRDCEREKKAERRRKQRWAEPDQVSAELLEQAAEIRKAYQEEQQERARQAASTAGVMRVVPGSIATDLGLSKEEAHHLRDSLAESQDGRCAICTLPFGPKMRASLDHCHRQKTVRGVLCRNCNVMLGMARDNPTVLQRAAAYILEHESAPSPSR